MMDKAKLSVVIPTYRRPELLRRCLEAIRQQICPDCSFEVLVISDGPDPVTESLMLEFNQNFPDFPLKYHPLPAKRGPAAARNLGWRKSAGELIVFTDDDCIPASSWLDAYWSAFHLRGKLLIGFTGKVEVPVPERPTDYQKNVAHLSTAEFITANCACSRAALELVGGFDEDFPIAWREDSELQFKLLKEQLPIVHVREALVCHPARAASWGTSIRDQQKSMFNALLFKKHPDLYRSKIASGPVWNYYSIIAATLLAFVGLIIHAKALVIAAFVVWAIAVVSFIIKRLKGTDVSFSHRAEMIITSLVIPYLSVYWTLRGALRYKVFFL
ncbi:glycosyltransferase family 2 protein [Dyadobacter sp. CY326]|uniref:glycosyltransferase family 2 protein n=1 Tax=Dyadobacter sp. CY326 TaxID=2907300 RepID=UPI001F3D28C3|nr:glycosyltransferase [Dyadobacter sp. CY326]MCE7064929.1 glycosyltransferase family 2 protein [Dyadobacter sp. CY326]